MRSSKPCSHICGAGIDRIVIITSPNKPAIEAYFEPSDDVVAKLRATGRHAMAERLESIGRDVQVTFVHQESPLGLGNAVACAAEAVGDEPFAVMLPLIVMLLFAPTSTAPAWRLRGALLRFSPATASIGPKAVRFPCGKACGRPGGLRA